MDIEFYNSFNNIFKSQEDFNHIYAMVEENRHRSDPRLKNLRLEDGLLFYKDRKKKLRVVSKLEIPEFLEDIYSKIETYGLGINKLNDVIKELFLGITRKDLVQFLKDKPRFQLNQPLYKVGRNNPIITRRSNFLYQADHMHLNSFPNQRYKYIFTCIDHFSKYAWAVAVTSLDSKHTIDAMKVVLSKTGGKKPRTLQVDGGIYKDKAFQEYIASQGIRLRQSSAYSPTENGLVENFNRQLRMRIYSGFIHHGNKEWKRHLESYVRGWNQTKHGTTKYRPDKIYNKKISKTMREEIIQNTKEASKFRKEKQLEVDQWVRISTPAYYSYIKAIDKSLLTKKLLVVKWTPQKFRIKEVIKAKSDMANDKYKLEDENGKELPNTFFKSDLKETTPYDKRLARQGIFSYDGVKDLDIKLNPNTRQAPVDRVVNKKDRPTEETRPPRNLQDVSVRLPPQPRAPSRRSKTKYKIDDFEVGDKIDVKYNQELDKYDVANDRWIRSKKFEDALIVDISDNENDQYPLFVDFGSAYPDEGRYDYVKISQVTKLTREN